MGGFRENSMHAEVIRDTRGLGRKYVRNVLTAGKRRPGRTHAGIADAVEH